MYAHNLIDNFWEDTGIQYEKGHGILRNIKNSHHFYLDSYQDFTSLCENIMVNGSPFFHKELCVDIGLPFKDFTIQYGDVNKKTILLITDLYDKCSFFKEGMFQILVFEKLNSVKRWAACAFGIIVTPNYDQNIRVFSLTGYKFSKKEDLSFAKSEYSHQTLWAVNAFLMLLNTKNIATMDNPPPAKLNKKRIKNGKQPLFTYKTLRLQLPAKKRKKGSGPATATDNTTRLHLCRGHFKTYTKDNPLFGSLTGRYWWQPHARGDKSQGVVMKDYEVKI